MSNHPYQNPDSRFQRYTEENPGYGQHTQPGAQQYEETDYYSPSTHNNGRPQITINTNNPYLQQAGDENEHYSTRNRSATTNSRSPQSPKTPLSAQHLLKQELSRNGRALAIARLTGTAKICENINHDLDCLCGLKKVLPEANIDLTPSRKQVSRRIVDVALADCKYGCPLEAEKSQWRGAILKRESQGHFAGLISIGIPLFDSPYIDMEGRKLVHGTTKVGGDGSTKVWYFGVNLEWLPIAGTVPGPKNPVVNPVPLCYGMEINPMTGKISVVLLHAIHPNEFEPGRGQLFYTLTRAAFYQSPNVTPPTPASPSDPDTRLCFSVLWGVPIDPNEQNFQDCIEMLVHVKELRLIGTIEINGVRHLNVEVVRPLPMIAKRCSCCGRWEGLAPATDWTPSSGFSRYHYRRWYECSCKRAWYCRRDCQTKFFKEQLEEFDNGGGAGLHGFGYHCQSLEYFMTCGEEDQKQEDMECYVSPIEGKREVERVTELPSGRLTEEAVQKFVEVTGSNRTSEGWVLATTSGRTGSDDSLKVGLGGKQDGKTQQQQHLPQFNDTNPPPVPPRHGFEKQHPPPPPPGRARGTTTPPSRRPNIDVDPTPEIPARYRVRKNTINRILEANAGVGPNHGIPGHSPPGHEGGFF